MRSYTTLDGTVIDLTELPPDLEAYLQACLTAYHHDMPWDAFAVLVQGEGSPLVRAAGMVTREVQRHPLYRALRDLEDRLGIAQGLLAPEPDDLVEVDPWADEWLSVPQAAALKGVTVPGLHSAIRRGAVLARPAPRRRPWYRVSRNSLARWTPTAVRQQAGRQSRRRAAEAAAR